MIIKTEKRREKVYASPAERPYRGQIHIQLYYCNLGNSGEVGGVRWVG